MTTPLAATLTTFGRPRVVSTAGDEIPLQPLPLALLTYLARGGPRDRDHLAELFWSNSKNGLNSLSTTLNRLREALPGVVWVEGNMLVGTDIASDVDDIHEAVECADVDSIVELYHAPFLGNLKLRRQSIEFEEWVLAERATLASTVEMALLQQASVLFEAGNVDVAADAVETAWEIAVRDGFPSPNCFEQYHRILASAGRSSVGAVRSMAEEFGIALAPVEPVAFGVGAAEAQPDVDPAVGAPARTPDEDLAAASATTQLFGCEQERLAIASSVAAGRLTTIIGLGGSGKTRLATEFFEHPTTERDFFARHWVNLREITDGDLVGPAIATAVGHRFAGIEDLAARLVDDKPVLLVLDNLEQILEAAVPIITELIESPGGLRVLVTSRVPLEVEHESLVQLRGLDWTDGELDSPAAQLFLASARRAGVGSDRLTGSNPAAILDVCRKVGGNPLSLEIAGGWAQILSPREIVDALSQSDELLRSPTTHGLRGMDAVLTHSWTTLHERERNTLMLLATFPAGCLTARALELAEFSIASIGRLVQHSLVELQIEGRITLHPLIAGHARAELKKRPELHRDFQQRLSTWCQGFAPANGPQPSGLDAEIANFTSAWSWDAQHGLWDLHRTTLGPLRQFFTDSGRLAEGKALFATTAATLRSDPDPDPVLLARVLEALGWCQTMAGEVVPARSLLLEAFALIEDGSPHERAQLRRTLGQLDLVTGDADAAATNFETGLALTDGSESPLHALLQYDLAQAHHYRGRHEEAANAARSALRAGRAANDAPVMVRAYILLADLQVESDPQRAVVLANEGSLIAQEASLDQLALYFPHLLGQAYLQLNDAGLAERHFGDGLKAASDFGQSFTVCANYFGRAEARLMGAQPDGAISDLTTGIRLALKIDSGRLLAWAAAVSCRLALSQGQDAEAQARALLLLVLGHPAADRSARERATATWHEFFDEPVPQPEATPLATGEPASPDEVAEITLGLLTICAANQRAGV